MGGARNPIGFLRFCCQTQVESRGAVGAADLRLGARRHRVNGKHPLCSKGRVGQKRLENVTSSKSAKSKSPTLEPRVPSFRNEVLPKPWRTRILMSPAHTLLCSAQLHCGLGAGIGDRDKMHVGRIKHRFAKAYEVTRAGTGRNPEWLVHVTCMYVYVT